MSNSSKGHKPTKARLAELMRIEDGSDRFEFVWDELKDYEVTFDWQNGDMSDEDILPYARRSLDRYHRHLGKGRSYSSGQGEKQKQELGEVQSIPVETTERERNATEALHKYLAAHAAKRPLVQRFRREHLWGGQLLPLDILIEEFLDEVFGTDVNDLEQILAPYRGRPSNRIPFPLYAEPYLEDGSPRFTNEDMAKLFAEQQSKQERQLEERWVDPAIRAHTSRDEASREVGRRLKELGDWLVNVYPWSDVGDAIVFVISGRPPRLAEPLSASMDLGTATYSITFSPWVSEESVVSAYRAIASNHYHRVPRDKTIQVLNFVLEQTDEEGHRPSMATLCDRWNKANPQDAFSHRSAFRRAYRRAVKALVPSYLPLGLEW